ncbi:MAG: prolyl oligopeptidase family serine peptidase [Candidatus Marinimicrobia bacterium]|nr:prolyl oligopeptidase family serine peptidase [Candidatus Neomarinimicrobiota bacterium]
MSSCDKEANEEPVVDLCNTPDAPGELLEATSFFSYAPGDIETVLSMYGAPIGLDLNLNYTVDTYQISYNTLDINGELTGASGLMLIPRGLDTLDLLSIQHGTVFKREQVGSTHPYFSPDGLITAMNGYLVVAPDYLGLGDSQLLHPYLHAGLSANAVMDLIRAARIYACQNELIISDRLFMAGYSEGGYVTLATQKIMETEHATEFQLTGVAPMAGPHDLLGSTLELLNRSYCNNPAYLAYIVTAYDDIYGWDRLDDIFQQPYAQRIPDLFDGTRDGTQINANLTSNLDSLFVPEFKLSFYAGGEEQLEAALIDNSPLGWGPIAPVRLFHGTADSTVFFENSEVAYASMLANGGLSVDLVALAGADHGTAVFPAYYFAMQWFDSLRTAD